jgi:TPP-dependent pyruvate/acetoin dehydrogenase alpha subunit
MPSQSLFGEPGAIARMVEATGVKSRHVDGRDVLAVSEVAAELVEHVRGGRPAFLECEVFRVRPHSIADPDYRYRPQGVGEDWLAANDPIENLRRTLGPAAVPELDRIDAEVEAEVASALAAAESAERTPAGDALLHRYATPELEARG